MIVHLFQLQNGQKGQQGTIQIGLFGLLNSEQDSNLQAGLKKRGLGEVGGRSNVASTASPVGVHPRLVVQALVRVRSKVISLRLQQVRRENSVSVPIKERQRGRDRRSRNPQKSALRNNVSPALRSLSHGLGKEGVKEQVLELGVLGVRSLDVTQEDRADNAASAPHKGNAGIVQVPAVLLGSLAHEHEALGVGDDLGSVEGLGNIVDELFLVASELCVGSRKDRRGTDTLVLDGREAAGKDGLTDEGDRHAIVESRDDSPLSSSLLLARTQLLFN